LEVLVVASMADFSHAINLIRKYEGFNEKAYPDPSTGEEPYTIGYGSQFYPDGSPVKQGHLCSKQKALEYLFHEVSVIDSELTKLNLGLDDCMRQALISFIHSVGWEPFLYSGIIDAIEREDFCDATQEIGQWIFDEHHRVIGGLLERRREEVNLFLREINANPWSSTEVLLAAFRNYAAAPHQVRAIRSLEEHISPYILAEFANSFCLSDDPWYDPEGMDADLVFSS
jgi:lysozyme